MKIHGLKELNNAMLKLPDKIATRIMHEAQKEAMSPVLEATRASAPRDTGLLADSVIMGRGRVDDRRFQRSIVIGLRVARVKDKGRDRDARINREASAHYGVMQELGYTVGDTVMPARPFLQPAFEAQASQLPVRLRDGLRKRLGKLT